MASSGAALAFLSRLSLATILATPSSVIPLTKLLSRAPLRAYCPRPTFPYRPLLRHPSSLRITQTRRHNEFTHTTAAAAAAIIIIPHHNSVFPPHSLFRTTLHSVFCTCAFVNILYPLLGRDFIVSSCLKVSLSFRSIASHWDFGRILLSIYCFFNKRFRFHSSDVVTDS